MPPDNKKNRKTRGGKMMRRARRQVRIANQPYFNELKQQGLQATQTYENSNERVGEIYNRLQNELGGLAPAYDQRAENIIGDTTAAVGQWAGLLNQGQSGAEQAAAESAFGAQGLAGTRLMEADRMRNNNFFQGVQSQAAVERMELQRDNLNLLNQMREEIALARRQGKALLPAQILERFDALRNQAREFRLAKREQQIRQDLANKELGLRERTLNQSNRQNRRARNAATEVLTDEQQRRELSKAIRRLQNQIGNVTGDIKEAKADAPSGWEGAGGAASASAEEVARLRRKRRRKRKKLQAKKKQRRNL